MTVNSGDMTTGKKNPKQGTGKGTPVKKKGVPAKAPKKGKC